MFCVKNRLLFSRSRSRCMSDNQNFIESLCSLYLLYHWSLANQWRCASLLFIITKPSTTKWACTDNSTLTHAITRHTTGGYFALQGDKPWFFFSPSYFCTYSGVIIDIAPHLEKKTLFFLGHHKSKIFQTLHDYNHLWVLCMIITIFESRYIYVNDDLDLVSRPQLCQKHLL